MNKPIREPAKPTKRMRFLLARLNRDPRFADFADELRELGKMFVATPSMIESAAAVVAYQLRQTAYVNRQTVRQGDQEGPDLGEE